MFFERSKISGSSSPSVYALALSLFFEPQHRMTGNRLAPISLALALSIHFRHLRSCDCTPLKSPPGAAPWCAVPNRATSLIIDKSIPMLKGVMSETKKIWGGTKRRRCESGECLTEDNSLVHANADRSPNLAKPNICEDNWAKPIDSCSERRKIIVMGGPASGKGTQCEKLAAKYNIVHISTGDMLRQAISDCDENLSSLAVVAKEHMERGELVPDDIVIQLVKQRLSQPDCQSRGWVLDGFPRTRAQAKALSEANLVPDTFLFFDVPDSSLIARVTGRRLDPVTNKIYHLVYSPPPDHIASRLVQRSDDTQSNIVSRLRQFHANEEDVKRWYADQIIEIDASGPPGEVREAVDQALSGLAKLHA